jgi:hypothetical protein
MGTPGYDKTFCLIRTVKMTFLKWRRSGHPAVLDLDAEGSE